MFEIKKGIPMPAHMGTLYNFSAMAVGDCFDSPRDMGQSKAGADKRQNVVGACARAYAKNHNPTAKFTIRVIDENTVRCWRIA